MAQLLVRNLSEALVRTLKLRAAEHGVSAEEEHRRILAGALAECDKKAGEKPTLFDHIRQLGEIAPDLEIERDRRDWARREVEL